MHLAILASFIITGILALPLAYARSHFEWEIDKGVAVPLVPLRFYITVVVSCISALLLIAYQVLGGFYEHAPTIEPMIETVFGWLAIVMPLALLAVYLWRPRAQRFRLRGR